MATPDDPPKRSVAPEPPGPHASERSGERLRERTGDAAVPSSTRAPYRDYVIKGEEGRGGLGRVLRAHDRRLDRLVAIKEILAEGPDAADASARFLREARLTAQLQHPSIVPVYEIGFRDDGAPFYAMKLIAGESFDVAIARTRALDERLALLPNVLAVAEAIAYAHDRGIIHRDIKPSNVIVGAFGETVVIDWGVAKDLGAATAAGPGASVRPPRPLLPPPPPPPLLAEGESEHARTGPEDPHAGLDVDASTALGDTILALGDSSGARTHVGRTLGTLGYMPPEQFRGEEVDARADVFALGAFLYQTVTGVGPYEGDARLAALDQISRGATWPIESREPAVPPDLAAIARKAMSPSPADRYATAKELAADLKRFLTGQLVSAHVYSRRVLLGRWLGKNRKLVILGVAFVSALGAIGAVSVRGVVRERDRAEKERDRAEKERVIAEARSQELTLVQARTSLERDPTASLAWLKTATFDDAARDEILSIAGEARARGVAKAVLRARGSGEVTSATLSLDGTRVYVGPQQAGLLVWDLARGAALHLLPASRILQDPVPTADGTHLVSASTEGEAFSVDLATEAVRALGGHTGRSRVAVARAGRLVASCGEEGTVRTWDLDSGAGHLVGDLGSACLGLGFGAGDGSLVAAGADRTLHLWDLRAGTSRTIPWGVDELRGVDASPDGRTIALVGGEGARALDVASGRWSAIPDSGSLNATAFAPEGDTWIGGDVDGAIHLWDLGGAPGERTLHGHTARIHTVEGTPASVGLLLSCADGEVTRVWDLASGSARVLGGHPELKECRFSHDHRAVLTSGNDGMVRVWDLSDGERVLSGHTGDVYAVAFSPDGSRVVTGSDDHTLRVWETASGRSFPLEGHTDVVEAVAFIDGSHVASTSDDGTVRVWDLAARTSFALPHGVRTGRAIPTRDGKTLVTTCRDGVVRVWDLATRQALSLRGHTAATEYIALSPDEERIASGSDDQTVRVWDRRTGAQLLLMNTHAEVTGLQFAGGGSLVVASGSDGVVRVWNAKTGELVRALTGHTDRVLTVSVSADGRRLVSCGSDRTVRIWDLDTGASRVLRGHTAEVRRAELSPDGRWVVSSSYDRTTRLWDAHTGRLLQVFRSDAAVMRSVFSPDQSLIASVGFDRMLRLVRVDPARFLPGDAVPFRAWLEATTSAVVREGGQVATPLPDGD